MLNCGHSYCEKCLELLLNKCSEVTPNVLICPSCQATHNFPNGALDLKKLIKNFTLLSLVETAKGAAAHSASVNPRDGLRKKSTPQDIFSKANSAGSLMMGEERKSGNDGNGRSSNKSSEEFSGDEKRRSQDENMNGPPQLQYNQKCEKHSLLIHSYVKGDNRELLCTKCIYEKNL